MTTRRSFLKLIAAVPVLGPLIAAPFEEEPMFHPGQLEGLEDKSPWPEGAGSEAYDYWSPMIVNVNQGFNSYGSAAWDEATKNALKKHIKYQQTSPVLYDGLATRIER